MYEDSLSTFYFYFCLLAVFDFMGFYLIYNHTIDLQIRPNEVMEVGVRDMTLYQVGHYPNADEI
jgi:hypothetical protein